MESNEFPSSLGTIFLMACPMLQAVAPSLILGTQDVLSNQHFDWVATSASVVDYRVLRSTSVRLL